MKEIRTTQAVGHILCHDITRIVRGVSKGVAFSKGHIVTQEDIPLLLELGKEHLYVWEKQEGFLHENEAADILYEICAGENMMPTPVKEGKIEVIAQVKGLLKVDIEKLRKINSLGEMMIATRRSNTPVDIGDHIAGTRVIPLVIEQEKMDQVKKLAANKPILTLYPYKPKKVAIITTGNEVFNGLINDTFTPVIREKISYFNATEIGHTIIGDDPASITRAINAFISYGAELILCTGGMSVDPDDKTPLAIKNTKARIVSYGSPVLPGAMFLLAYTDEGIPIMGLPGCVMYAKRTIFDLILPRIMADIQVNEYDLAALGHGGLCLNCESCIFPNCGFGSGI